MKFANLMAELTFLCVMYFEAKLLLEAKIFLETNRTVFLHQEMYFVTRNPFHYVVEAHLAS